MFHCPCFAEATSARESKTALHEPKMHPGSSILRDWFGAVAISALLNYLLETVGDQNSDVSFRAPRCLVS